MSKGGKIALIIMGIITIFIGIGVTIGAWCMEDAKEEIIHVSVYTGTSSEIDEMTDYIEGVRGVKSVKYYSVDEVFEEKQKQGYYKNYTSVSGTGLNPYFKVTVKKNSVNRVMKELRNSKYKSKFYSIYKEYKR